MTSLRMTALAVVYALTAYAQSTTGTITGSVTDSSAGTIVQATIRLTDTGTGVTRTTVSGNDGDFAFRLLPPGIYRLEAGAAGFKTFDRAGIVVDAERSMAVPVRLALRLKF